MLQYTKCNLPVGTTMRKWVYACTYGARQLLTCIF